MLVYQRVHHIMDFQQAISAARGGNLQVEVVPLCELLSEEWLLKPLNRRFFFDGSCREERYIYIHIYMGFNGI